MKISKPGFVIYKDQRDLIMKLRNDEAGKLLKAFFDYHHGKNVKLNRTLDLVFESFKKTFERDNKKYERIVERNRENIKKRWGNKAIEDTIGKTGIPKDTKNTDRDINRNIKNEFEVQFNDSKYSYQKTSKTNLTIKRKEDDEWKEHVSKNGPIRKITWEELDELPHDIAVFIAKCWSKFITPGDVKAISNKAYEFWTEPKDKGGKYIYDNFAERYLNDGNPIGYLIERVKDFVRQLKKDKV